MVQFINRAVDKIRSANRPESEKVTRGESVYSVATADGYIEDEPTVAGWFREVTPSGKDVLHYIHSLFPFTHWILRYNLQWLIGDLVAGITVGAVVVPQSMAYAKLAKLPVEYGLYASFMGVMIYWFFATSKDITIGPVAVLSLQTGNVVTKVLKAHKQYTAPEVARALAVICGAIVCFLGLFRLGFVVDFISLSAIAAFMTGSAINIAAGQVPAMMGITGFDTRASTYRVIINTLKGLPRTNLNAALGLTALTMLYIIRFACSYSAKRFPKRAKLFFFISTLRTAFVLCLYILISYLMVRHHKKKPPISILGKVPRGFQHAGVPEINTKLISAFSSEIPATVIVMLIEHISISKSFGRVNNYVINPSQELTAIGITNLFGPFVGAYPATGSFSRTAIKSKAGVRTPFAGVITGIVVVIAIYALTAMFYYIPNAALSAVIIHAVGDLITSPKTLYKFYKISPLEVLIYFAGVFVTVFSSIENGIYTTVATSFALYAFRIFKAKGRFLGRVRIHEVAGEPTPNSKLDDYEDKHDYNQSTRDVGRTDGKSTGRQAYLPIDHYDGSNPMIELEPPYPGVIIYRFPDGFNYLNANHYLEHLTEVIFKQTRRTNPLAYPKPGDRPWNDPGPKKGEELKEDTRPTLKAVVLDFSSVNHVDVTSVQNLIDVRNQLDRYTTPDVVEWHFAAVNNRWTKRALVSAGFGNKTLPQDSPHVWRPIFSVAEIGGDDSAAKAARVQQGQHIHDLETGRSEASSSTDRLSKTAVVHGINRPLFHVDLEAAVEAAIHSVSPQQPLKQSADPHAQAPEVYKENYGQNQVL